MEQFSARPMRICSLFKEKGRFMEELWWVFLVMAPETLDCRYIYPYKILPESLVIWFSKHKTMSKMDRQHTPRMSFPVQLDVTSVLDEFYNSSTHIMLSCMIFWPTDTEKMLFVQVSMSEGKSTNARIVLSYECALEHVCSHLG